MTTQALSLGRLPRVEWGRIAPSITTGVAYCVLFAGIIVNTLQTWWNDPDASHGVLLVPLALYLAWKQGLSPNARPQRLAGCVMIGGAVILRYVSGLAAELFTMRISMFGALFGLIVFAYGLRQLAHWWLPVTLVVLSIPFPALVMESLALPLQFKASEMGAAMLEWRHVPVLLEGNVIHLPGRTLFVTEACSGLRSLTSLLSLGVLIGGLWLRFPITRAVLILAALPLAILLNGVRVFLTGFLVYFVDPKLGEGFMHLTEGWIIFVVAFAMLGAVSWVLLGAENLWRKA